MPHKPLLWLLLLVPEFLRECKSESPDFREHGNGTAATPETLVDSPGSHLLIIKDSNDSNDTVLRQLFNLFLELHQRVDDAISVPPRQADYRPRNLSRGDASSRADANETETEFGAPVASAPPDEDVAVLLSVLLTTALVFLCFLVLLAVKCCAELCCIDLLYCMCRRCRNRERKPPDSAVVLRVKPNSQSLERLLRHNVPHRHQ